MKDASHLSLLEHGVYMRLLDVYYTKEAPIPLDQAARLIGVRSKDEKQALADISNEFFSTRYGYLVHKRCDEEIALMLKKTEINREIGKRGGRPKKETQTVSENNPEITQTVSENNPEITQTVSENNPEITQTVSENNPSHKPITINHNKQTHTVENLTSVEPSAAASVCLAMKRQGVVDINPSHPTLLALLEAGASLDEFAVAAQQAVHAGKKFAYALGIVKRQREEAAKLKLHQGAMPHAPPKSASQGRRETADEMFKMFQGESENGRVYDVSENAVHQADRPLISSHG